MSVVPRLVRRSPGIIDLVIRNRPGVVAYRIVSAVSLDTAYGGGTSIINVVSGGMYASPRVAEAGLDRIEDRMAGLTRVVYDAADFASADVPGDTNVSFIRVEEILPDGSILGPGPILVIPPPDFYETGRRSIVLTGTAPNVAGRANNLPPETAMRFYLSRFADELIVYNEGAVGGDLLYFSFGLGLQEMRVPAGGYRSLSEAGVNEILIRGDGNTVAFSLSAALVNGLQA